MAVAAGARLGSYEVVALLSRSAVAFNSCWSPHRPRPRTSLPASGCWNRLPNAPSGDTIRYPMRTRGLSSLRVLAVVLCGTALVAQERAPTTSVKPIEPPDKPLPAE